MDRQGNVIFTERPALKRPNLVCGIGGWVDGGEAATGSIRYLVRKLGAKMFAEIPVGRFRIFQMPGQLAMRPRIRMEKGIIKEHRFPRNQFFYRVNPGADNDLILFRGMEPNLNWEEYADALLGLADELAVARIYLLGGVLDKTPHTREPGVTCACSSEQLREEMRPYGVQFSEYEGPGSFSTTLLHICRSREKEAVSLTARASYYPEFNIVISRNPKTIRTLVRRLNHLLCLNLDISDLDIEADELEEKLNLMAGQNPNLQAYIEGLEKDFLEVKYEEPLEMSPDEAVRIAEEFLRGNRED